MAENETGAAGDAAPKAQPEGQQQQAQPQINAIAQYTKDFSFEAPHAPAILREMKGQPEIGLNVSVNANTLGNDQFDVRLKLDSKAQIDGKVLFHVELEYGGIFRVTGFPQEHLTPVVYIECPRLLFPFARQIIANTVQSGGFPPLMLEPIDFAQLFARSAAEARARQQVSENAAKAN